MNNFFAVRICDLIFLDLGFDKFFPFVSVLFDIFFSRLFFFENGSDGGLVTTTTGDCRKISQKSKKSILYIVPLTI